MDKSEQHFSGIGQEKENWGQRTDQTPKEKNRLLKQNLFETKSETHEYIGQMELVNLNNGFQIKMTKKIYSFVGLKLWQPLYYYRYL